MSLQAVLQTCFQSTSLDTAARSSTPGDTWARAMFINQVTDRPWAAGEERPSAALEPPNTHPFILFNTQLVTNQGMQSGVALGSH